ncbi:cyclin-dependent kinase 9-like [Trichogramma pretiosum]|uniref:cyclin-dependent kinase 9-like n=1 Tax=Trichogramma pretiosum TaxID=7493 RepID=UPI0006C953CC|nr:cyclin-dependent kinase 9-like [Trichogramma pretiosum]
MRLSKDDADLTKVLKFSSFSDLSKIGSGSYGVVFKAKYKGVHDVALKKVLYHNESEGFPLSSIREIRLLTTLDHPNIVKMFGVINDPARQHNNWTLTFYIVFEYCNWDLANLLMNKSITILDSEIKHMLQQVLTGLSYLHSKNVLHRDLKSSNILVNKNGALKICDFGLSKRVAYDKNGNLKKSLTNRVVTVWYRAPELLLGEKYYDSGIDMWSVACIMAEMWKRCPALPGKSEQNQLNLIMELCGSITPINWPQVEKFPLYKALVLDQNLPRSVSQKYQEIIECPNALDLLERLFTLDPKRRIDANTALSHPYFFVNPEPEPFFMESPF